MTFPCTILTLREIYMHTELVKNNVPGVPVKISRTQPDVSVQYICPIHIHDDIEILAEEQGAFYVDIEGTRITLDVGDVIVINRRVPHSTTKATPDGCHILLQFRIEKLRSEEFEKINKYLSFILANDERKYVCLKSSDDTTKEIYDVIKKLYRESSDERQNYDIFIKGYMEVLLGLLYRNKILVNIEDSYNKDAVNKIWPVIEYIDKNYPYKLTLEQLSGVLNLNREYFCRIFKEATGITPVEYVNYVRVLKAETLLTSTSLTITEISLDVGFASMSYFNRIFKKLKGITPSVYKEITYAKNRLI